mmetsp:Transcript_17393/g.43330  ORF Transcript_17393/g.43330 Transcript_17393/m.43330 type:complete len:258 (-) Transcript_17393:2182-2955(-)
MLSVPAKTLSSQSVYSSSTSSSPSESRDGMLMPSLSTPSKKSAGNSPASSPSPPFRFRSFFITLDSLPFFVAVFVSIFSTSLTSLFGAFVLLSPLPPPSPFASASVLSSVSILPFPSPTSSLLLPISTFAVDAASVSLLPIEALSASSLFFALLPNTEVVANVAKAAFLGCSPTLAPFFFSLPSTLEGLKEVMSSFTFRVCSAMFAAGVLSLDWIFEVGAVDLRRGTATAATTSSSSISSSFSSSSFSFSISATHSF